MWSFIYNKIGNWNYYMCRPTSWPTPPGVTSVATSSGAPTSSASSVTVSHTPTLSSSGAPTSSASSVTVSHALTLSSSGAPTSSASSITVSHALTLSSIYQFLVKYSHQLKPYLPTEIYARLEEKQIIVCASSAAVSHSLNFSHIYK